MRARTIAALLAALVCLTALIGLPAVARADAIEEAVTTLLKLHTKPLVRVEFSLKRVDGQGGTEMKLQGVVIGEEGLVLVSGATGDVWQPSATSAAMHDIATGSGPLPPNERLDIGLSLSWLRRDARPGHGLFSCPADRPAGSGHSQTYHRAGAGQSPRRRILNAIRA